MVMPPTGLGRLGFSLVGPDSDTVPVLPPDAFCLGIDLLLCNCCVCRSLMPRNGFLLFDSVVLIVGQLASVLFVFYSDDFLWADGHCDDGTLETLSVV